MFLDLKTFCTRKYEDKNYDAFNMLSFQTFKKKNHVIILYFI